MSVTTPEGLVGPGFHLSSRGPDRYGYTEVICADLTEWLHNIKKAREARLVVENLDAGIFKQLGVLVAEKTLYLLGYGAFLDGIRKVPPEITAFFGHTPESFHGCLRTPQDRVNILCGGYTGMFGYHTPPEALPDLTELESIWQQEAGQDKMLDQGQIDIERPAAVWPPRGLRHV